ncbi:hypothetical protein QBC35DRAFT_495826 [Podospora australis]|uniref:Trichothecene 3-O-acetyltransferase-like N-terminal domain-containing protein n=1 Tax=Podospora australis TaxID=1536484 RepID=A0AAN6WW10_9PEZI|nr:hypothetical protein QBC35DRAFT_495826 [Podospora australis]
MTPSSKIIHLHPQGWENDPADEYFKLSTLDYCVGQVYTNYALFFKLPSPLPTDHADNIIATLQRGLEITLSQCRQLCGTLSPHPSGDGSLCFHKTRDSTVEFHIQSLPAGNGPPFADLQSQHFASRSLGDMSTWCVAPMTYGEKPEAHPSSQPKASAFKLSFITGGAVFMMHHHHYANDVMGWAGELHQLAENCAAVWNDTSLPSWDKSCLGLSRLTVEVPPEQQVDGPVSPAKHPDHKRASWLLFHLPKSKTAELKALAYPDEGYISSYDAYTALLWGVLTKHRLKLFPDANPSSTLLWGEAVDMRRRLKYSPPIPARIQGNVVHVALSAQSVVPPLTVQDVVSAEVPLSRLAGYIRSLTNGATQASMEATLAAIAPIKDKSALFLRVDSFPPLSNFISDWRDTNHCEADFGFGKPFAFRFPFDTVTNGLAIVYPVRSSEGAPAGEDEGNEFSIAIEDEIREDLLKDEEWTKWFEYRGVDAGDLE